MEIQRGQKIKLSDLTSALELTVALDIEMQTGEADVTCFGIDEQNKLSDDRYFVFYNQLSSPNGEIQMNTFGKVTEFHLQLDRIPGTIKKLVFTVTNDADLAVTAIRRGVLSIKAGGREVARSEFNGSAFQQEKAIIMIELYIRDGIWRVSSVMSGFNGGLSALLAHFGGEEAQPEKSGQPIQATTKPAAPSQSPLSTPAPAATPASSASPAPKRAVSLKKPGDSHKISLKKANNRLHVNLNWDAGNGLFGGAKIDLDLACMYRLKDGRTSVVQALGNCFGSEADSPYIRLDHDDRSGSSKGGENMFFCRPETIDIAVVFAFIYEGAVNWSSTNARIAIHQDDEPDIEIYLDKSHSDLRSCVIAVLENTPDGLKIRREEKYFNGHRSIDQNYGFGLQWTTGRK